MNYLGSDFNSSGSVMAKSDLAAARTKRGECISCGRKCYKKKLFKMVPIDAAGTVLNGRCLNCQPLQFGDGDQGNGGDHSGKIVVSDSHHHHHINQKMNSPRRQNSHQSHPSLSKNHHHHRYHQKQKTRKSKSITTAAVAVADYKSVTPDETKTFKASRRTKSHSPSSMNYYGSSSSSGSSSGGSSISDSAHSKMTAETAALTTRPSIATTHSSIANTNSSSSDRDHHQYRRRRHNNNHYNMTLSTRSIGNASSASTSSKKAISLAAVATIPTRHRTLNNSNNSTINNELSIRSLVGRSVDTSDKSNSNEGSAEIAWMPPPHHSEFSNDSNIERGDVRPPSRINSYNSSASKALPTRKELEQAAITLMAAQEHGLDNVFDELVTSKHYHHRHNNSNSSNRVMGSLHQQEQEDDEASNYQHLNRVSSSDSSRSSSVRSGGRGVEETKEEAPITDDENENDIGDNGSTQDHYAAELLKSPTYRHPRQQRGVLNRGGAFSGQYGHGGRHLTGVGVGTQVFTRSCRTLSSMSSIGEEDHVGRTPTRSPSACSNNNNSNSNSNSNIGPPSSPGIYNMRIGSLSRFCPESFRTLGSLSAIDDVIDEEEMQSSFDENLGGSFGTKNTNYSGLVSDEKPSDFISVTSKSVSSSSRSSSRRSEVEIETVKNGTDGLPSVHSCHDDTSSLSLPKRNNDKGPNNNDTFIINNDDKYNNNNSSGNIDSSKCFSLMDKVLILKDNFESLDETKQILEILSNMPLGINDETPRADLIGMEVIVVDAMEAHQSDRDVQHYGCGAICRMSDESPHTQREFVKAGAARKIVLAMKQFLTSKGNQDLQEKAITALSNLGAAQHNAESLVRGAGPDEGGTKSDDDDGVIGAIIDTMGQYSEYSGIQAKGCSAIMNLASHNDPNLRIEIMDKGVATAILFNAMAMHADDATVQEAALKAVWNLCADCETNQTKFLEFGVIDFVLTAMDRHQDIPGVQEAGAWIIYNLAKDNNETKMVIGDNRGIDTILRTVTFHLKHAGVVEWSIRALFTLTFDPHNAASCLEKTADEKLPPAITTAIDAMMAHEDVPAIQGNGCALLTNLANLGNDAPSSNLGVDRDQTKIFIVDGEALDVINMAMVLHRNESRVQHHACTLLHTLAIEENHAAILAAIGIDMQLVKDAANNFPDQCKESADKIFDLLCVDNEG